MDYAHVVLLGRLTKPVELKYLPSGTAVCDLSVAVGEKRRTKDGDLSEKTHFFDVTVFGKQAESCNEYLVKGQEVLIDGKLVQDRWEDNDGKNRSRVKVNANFVHFGSKPKNAEQGEYSQPRAYADDNVPF